MSDSLRIILRNTRFCGSTFSCIVINSTSCGGDTPPPDKPARGKKLTISPVKELALTHNIPVYQPASLKPEENHEWIAANKQTL